MHNIEVLRLGSRHRQMLLEMLASERSGESAVDFGRLERRRVAFELCEMSVARQVGPDHAVLTPLGRHVAERLVARLLGDSLAWAC